MPTTLNALLAISPADAERLAPAVIRPFPGWKSEEIRRYLAAAVRASRLVNTRHALLDAKGREAAWDAPGSIELRWFGVFSRHKARKVRATFEGITQHLSSWRLDVVGDPHKTSYASALPVIRKITLGQRWVTPPAHVDADGERVQTFVHEASHICGRFSADEANGYGAADAQALAGDGMRATRNADNYGYYAIDAITAPPVSTI